MLFSANSNRKISASLFDEMFDFEQENTAVSSNHQELLKELEQLKFITSNKTIEVLLEELQQNQQKVCDLYSLDHINYSFSSYQQTLHYKKIQVIRTQIKELALWLFDGQLNAMPFELRKHFS
jgi:hypothetical protein